MAGALIVIVGILAIVMIHEGGHLIAAKAFDMKATEYFLGFGPRIWSFRRGETEYGIKAIPAGGYVRIIGMNPIEDVDPAEEHRTYRGKPFWQKAIVVMSGIASHFVIAFILLWVANVLIGETDFGDASLEVAAVVDEVDGAPSAAASVGIQPGDRIIGFEGDLVDSWRQLTEQLRARPNEEVDLTIQRGSQTFEVSTTLGARTDSDGNENGFLGVSPVFNRSRDGVVEGVVVSAVDVAVITKESVAGIGQFVWNFGSVLNSVFDGGEVTDEGRPVSVIGLSRLGAATQRAGLEFTLQLLAFFSIFVGILNAIPLYPFDGGHFAVALYEKVTNREPDIRKMMPFAAAMVVFLLVLFVLGIYLDIASPFDLG